MIVSSRSSTVNVDERPADQEAIICQVARSRGDRASAFRLLHEGYVAGDLMVPNQFGMRVTPWQVLPSTQIYVAKQESEILYTMSLVPDGWGGLPLEEVYADEVQSLRAAEISLAEVTCLTSSKKYDHAIMFDIFVDLVALMFQQARFCQVDGLAIAIHPRHVSFYERKLGFRQIGPQRAYSLVDGKPAVMCYHDFAELDVVQYPLYDRIYSQRLTAEELAPAVMPAREREFLEPVIEATVGQRCLTVG